MKIIKISLTIALIASLNVTAGERSSLMGGNRPGYGTIQTPYRSLNIQEDEPVTDVAADLATLEVEAVVAGDLSNSINRLEEEKRKASSIIRKEGTYRDRVLRNMEFLSSKIIKELAPHKEVLTKQKMHVMIENLIADYLRQSETIHQHLLSSKDLFGRRSNEEMRSINQEFDALIKTKEEILRLISRARDNEEENVRRLADIRIDIAIWENEFKNPNAYLEHSTYENIQSCLTSDLIGDSERDRLQEIFNYLNTHYKAGYDYLHDGSIYWKLRS